MKFGTDNPLNDFTSYSVHYRVLVTTKLEWAQELVKEFANGLIARKDPQQYNVDTDTIERKKLKIGQASYYDLIDSSKNADIFVTKYTFMNYLNISPDERRGYGEAIEMELNLHEAYSGNFIGFLNSVLADQDTTQLFFVIKPYFVGIKLNNINVNPTTQSVEDSLQFIEESYILNPANIMLVTDIKANYSPSGSDYVLKGVCDLGGLGNSPTIHVNLVNQLSLSLPPNASIETVIEKLLTDKMNSLSEQRTVQDSTTKQFIRYTYKFILDDEYKNSSDYLIDSISPIHTKKGKNDPTISFSDCTINDVIFKILSCSQKILNDAMIADSFKDVNGVRISSYYKPYVTTQVKEIKSNTYQVIYKINKQQFFKSVNSLAHVVDVNKDLKIIEELFKTVDDLRPSILVYDYIFTGRNVDLLDYKLSLTNGIIATLANEKNNILGGVTKQSTTTLNTVNTDAIFDKNAQQTVKKPQDVTTSKNPNLLNSFYDVINRASFLEVLQNQLVVTGNPVLLGSLLIGYNKDNRVLGNNTIFIREKIPALIFVNVQYPVSPNFWSHDTNYSDKPNIGSFWFRGVQQILTIETTFEGNNFFHTINTYPLMTTKQQADDVLNEFNKAVNEEIIATSTAQLAIEKVKNNNDKIQRDRQQNISASSNETDAQYIGRLKNGNYLAQRMNIRLPAEVSSFKLPSGTPLSNITITSSYAVVRRRTKTINSVSKTYNGYHYGMDLSASAGTSVKCGVTGSIRCYKVTDSDKTPGWGIDVTDNNGITIRYYHVTPLTKYIGPNAETEITPNDVIGTVRTFTAKSGLKSHLHMELIYEGKVYNPQQLFSSPSFKNAPDVIKVDF